MHDFGRGGIVVMDNLCSHKRASVHVLIKPSPIGPTRPQPEQARASGMQSTHLAHPYLISHTTTTRWIDSGGGAWEDCLARLKQCRHNIMPHVKRAATRYDFTDTPASF